MKLLLKLAITLVFVAIILWQLGGLGEVITLMSTISPMYVLLVILVHTLDRALMTYKWKYLLDKRGVHLPFFQGLKIYCTAMIWGMVLPATLGADAVRAFSTHRLGLDSNEIIASIAVERIVGFVSAILLGLLSLLLLYVTDNLHTQFALIWWAGSAMLIAALAIILISFSQSLFDFVHKRLLGRFHNRWLMHKLRQLHMTYQEYANNKPVLLNFLGLTLVEQMTPILHSWLIAQAMGIQVGLLYVAGVVPLTILISRIPISIDGLGVFDGIFIVLMSFAGVSPAQAVAITLVGRITQIAAWLPWWLAYTIEGRTLQPPRPLAEESSLAIVQK